MKPSVLGLDVGGANLKAAHSTGVALLHPFELWKHPAELPAALRHVLGALPAFDSLSVTMTGELCDCFPTKRAGVHAILDAVAAVAGDVPVHVWQTNGRLVPLAAARAYPLQAAASNWLALATFGGRYAPEGAGLLIDIGSTTTDIVPLFDGCPIPQGRTDPERLRSRELVYTGVRRTPVCALLGPAVAAEWFATTLDVYLVLGSVSENQSDHGTADGRPAIVEAAHARLARMLCANDETCSATETSDLARRARERQLGMIREALHEVTHRLPGRLRTVIVAGSGEFLARAAAADLEDVAIVSLAEQLGPRISEAACAYALAMLAADQGGS
jgi:probable H4MPT-linked C1 transfer pathway protein